MRQPRGDFQVLFDQDDARALAVYLCEYVYQVSDDTGRQAFGRFVQQQDAGVAQQRARDRQHLLLAARPLVAV
ncbi:hypothetical protein G6F22_021795 [Rhizopus arrhizus]|nr:hypothetical protein G6F22_021795 [Rhizopus arrhizus]